jgi:FtsP/CotA-like multicopper oxidase with cupredoxin domain
MFDLRLQQGTSQLLAGKPTTWDANGAHLGPTLRATRGDQVVLHVRNDLPEPTTIHWHGMHLPAAADGGPHQPIDPGATWSPSWRID